MSIFRKIGQDIPGGVDLASTPEGLAAIHQPGCAAVIWSRTPLPAFQSWLNDLAPEHLPRTRMILRPERVRAALQALTQTAGTPAGTGREMLINDVSAMADIFARVTGAPYLRLRLDVISGNACRKFHIDAVTARLVCTYRGTGTQCGTAPDGAEPNRIFTVPTGAPIILRGTLWPAQPDTGLLHRSPPIEGTGETRLVLVLDPVADLENEPEHEVMTRH